MLPRASSGIADVGLKYLYNSQRDDIVPRRPTDPIDSFPAQRTPEGAQLIAIPKSAVNPTTEMKSRFCRNLICPCLVELPASLWLCGMLLSADCVLEKIMKQ